MKQDKLSKKLLDYAKKFPDGFTVYIKDGKLKPVKANDKKRYVISKTNNDTVKKIKESFEDTYTGYAGGWYDTKHKRYYIDKNILAPSKEKALKAGRKYKQQAIFDLLKFKEIPVTKKVRNVCIRREGKWINTISKREVTETYAKRLNAYFKKHPDKGTLTRAYGGLAFNPKKHVSKQGEKIEKLFFANRQVVKTKTRKGKEVVYSPLTDMIAPKDIGKILNRLDYQICDGKIHVHLYKLTRDRASVYHILHWNIDRMIEHEWAYDDLEREALVNIIPCLRNELRKIKKDFPLAKGKYGMKMLSHISISLHSKIDFYPYGYVFGQYLFNNDGINRTMIDIIKELKTGFKKVHDEGKKYRSILFRDMTFYIKAKPNMDNMKLANFRHGVRKSDNGY